LKEQKKKAINVIAAMFCREVRWLGVSSLCQSCSCLFDVADDSLVTRQRRNAVVGYFANDVDGLSSLDASRDGE
jgi:hypothetical protein